MVYIPLFLSAFRWKIEVSYKEQKTFWSLCSYMVRSRKGIELLVNFINIAYYAIKILPYQEEAFAEFKKESVQEFRFALSQQIFYAHFVKNIESLIKSNAVKDALKQLIQKQCGHL